MTAMKTSFARKHLWIGLASGLAGVLLAPAGFSQTPVSTSLHYSGTCAKCNLSHRVMPGLSLQGANFTGSDFSFSNLSGARLSGANLVLASFHKAYLMRADGKGVNMNGAVLSGTTLSDARLTNSSFIKADFRKADLTGGDFSSSIFSGAHFLRADAVNAIFVSADFSDARLDRSDFTGADFTNAHFLRTRFGDAILTRAKLDNAVFEAADLGSVMGLTQEQLDTACGIGKTALPDGIVLKACTDETPSLSVEAEAQATSTPLTVVSQSKPARHTIFFSPARRVGNSSSLTRNVGREDPMQDLNEAMRLIDRSMRDLPMGSPTRKRLSQAREKLSAAQAAGLDRK